MRNQECGMMNGERRAAFNSSFRIPRSSLPSHSARQVVVPLDALEEVEVREHLARAEHDRGERVVGDRDGQARLYREPLVQVLQQRPAARQHDAALDDVGRKLGRRPLKGDADGVDDGRHRVGQGLPDLLVGDGDGLGDALDEVAAAHVHRERLVEGEARAELNLDGLGRALAYQKVVLALDVLRDGLVHLVTCDAHGAGVDDAGQAYDGDVGRAAADVHDHVAVRLRDGEARADGRAHGLLDEVDLAGLRAVGRVLDRAALDLRDLGGYADDDARADPGLAVVRLAYEVLEHLLRHFEVGDDAVLHGPYGDDVAGRPAQHLLRLLADGLRGVGDFVDGDDGGLADDDASPLREDERVGRAEVNCEVAGEK